MTDPSRPPISFRFGEIAGIVTQPLPRYDDHRGWLIELYRRDELDPDYQPVMAYVSETLPGVVRGPHEHRDQSDYLAFVGPGDFKLYMWDPRSDSVTFGNRSTMIVGGTNRQAVIIPPGVVHAYKNLSDVPSLVLNFPDRLYGGFGKQQPIDEIRHEERADCPFLID